MTFYTAKGDDGTTGLLGDGRVPKYHVRMEAIGALDEASAAIGLARAQCSAPQTAPILLEAQRDLYKLMWPPHRRMLNVFISLMRNA